MKPLGLPIGSVRAILAMALTAAVIYLGANGTLDPNKIFDLALLALGFYFITRDGSPSGSPSEPVSVVAAPVAPPPTLASEDPDAPTIADLIAENAELRARLERETP